MTEETKGEETPTNPEEEETSEEKTSIEEGQTSKETDQTIQELEEKNKQLFARAKKAEDKLKANEPNEPNEPAKLIPTDTLDLAKTVAALKDFSPDEMDYIQLIAKGKGISLDEAVKTNEVETFVKAERGKVADKNKIPGSSESGFSSPTQKTTNEIKEMTSDTDEHGNMTQEARDKHRKYFEKMKQEEGSQE